MGDQSQNSEIYLNNSTLKFLNDSSQNSEIYLNNSTLKFLNDSFDGEGLSEIEAPTFVEDLSFLEGSTLAAADNSTTLIGATGFSFRSDYDGYQHSTTITNTINKGKKKNDFGFFNCTTKVLDDLNEVNLLSKEDIEGNKHQILCESLKCIFIARNYLRKSYNLSQKKKYRDDFKESTFKDLGLSNATTKGCLSETFLHILKCCYDIISPNDIRTKLTHLWPIKDKKQITPVRKVFLDMLRDTVKANCEYFKDVIVEHIPGVLQVPNGERFTRFLSGLLHYTLDKHMEKEKRTENDVFSILYHFKESNDIDMIKLQIQLLESNTKDLERQIEREGNRHMKNSRALEKTIEYDLPGAGCYLPFDDTLTEIQDLEDNLDHDIEERVKAYLNTQKVNDFEFGLSDDLLDKGLQDDILDKKSQIRAIIKEIEEPLAIFSTLMKRINKRNGYGYEYTGPAKKYSIDASKILDGLTKDTQQGVKYNFNELINLRIEEIQNLLKLEADQPPPQFLVEMLLALDKQFARVKKLLDDVNVEPKIQQIDAEIDLLKEEAKGIDWTILTDVSVRLSGWTTCLKKFNLIHR